MLVKDLMTRHPIMVPPTTPAAEAQKIMAESHIRHLPVVGDGKRLLGLITRQRLALKPDYLTSLNVWEITRYLSDLTVRQIMLPADQVRTITPDRTIEHAAQSMSENKIGCLLVLEEGLVVGIITEIDLLKGLQEMLGLPYEGIRVTIRVPNRRGEYGKVIAALAEQNWGIMGIGSFPCRKDPEHYDMVLKIPNVNIDEVREVLSKVQDQEVVDIRAAL